MQLVGISFNLSSYVRHRSCTSWPTTSISTCQTWRRLSRTSTRLVTSSRRGRAYIRQVMVAISRFSSWFGIYHSFLQFKSLPACDVQMKTDGKRNPCPKRLHDPGSAIFAHLTHVSKRVYFTCVSGLMSNSMLCHVLIHPRFIKLLKRRLSNQPRSFRGERILL